MRIVFVHRRRFHERPPVINVIQYLTDMGHQPYLLTTDVNEYYKEWLGNRGVESFIIPFNITKNSIKNAINGFKWGVKSRSVINRISQKEPIVLWVEGNYTFYSLTARFINKFPHVLQHQELFNMMTSKGRYMMKLLAKIMPSAVVNIAPEYNRSCIYSALLKLKQQPVLLPNKPVFFPSKVDLENLGKKYNNLLCKTNGRKIILYQGILSKERNLGAFMEALLCLDVSQYVVVLLGRKTELVEQYKKINPDIIHIDYIPAPDYLYITSRAYIGIVTYVRTELNTMYCAPNKIFEYGAYGIPMIGNDIPGLRYTIKENKMGDVCDETSVNDIKRALKYVVDHYDECSMNALKYFNSVDNKKTMESVVDTLEKKLKDEIR